MKQSIGAALLIIALVGCGRSGGDDDGGDNGGDGDGGAGGDDVKIQDIQDDAMPVGTAVGLKGVVVTAIDTYGSRKGGIYVQEPEGGEYSGIFVYLSGAAAADLEVGQLVDVAGGVKDEFAWQGGGCDDGEEETDSLTEISPTEGGGITVTDAGDGTLPTPPELNAWDLSGLDGAAEAEKWEGVPVTLTNIRALREPEGVDEDDPTLKELLISGPFSLSSSLTELSDSIAEGDCYSSVTGIVDWFFTYKLLPRTAADLVTGDSCAPIENTAELCDDGMDNDHTGNGDCADFACQGAVEACTTDHTVAELQGGDVERDMRVRLTDVVVLGRSFNGKRIWVSDDVATSGPETGIYLYRPSEMDALDASITQGKTIPTLEGSLNERLSGCTNNPLSQLAFVDEGFTATGGGAGPDPNDEAPLSEIVSDGPDGEQWEGTLVSLSGLEVTEINQNESFNLEFTVSDGTSSVVIDDDIFRYADVEVGQCLDVIGIVSYNTFDESQDGGLPPHVTINPRAASEVDVVACP